MKKSYQNFILRDAPIVLDCNSDFRSYDSEDYDLGLIQDENSAKKHLVIPRSRFFYN